NVNAGILEANAASSLGAITAGTVVASGATLNVNAAVGGEQLTLNGTGFGNLISGGFLLPRGALTATGNSSWNGNIILNSSPGVINTNGNALTVNGIISGTDLIKVGANTVGTNALTLNAANTFTGNLTVSAGVVVLTNANTYSGATTIGATAQLTVNSF